MRIRQTAVRIANLTFVSPDLAPSDNRSHSTRFKLLRLKWRGRRDGGHTPHRLLLQFRITASSQTAQRRLATVNCPTTKISFASDLARHRAHRDGRSLANPV